MRGIGGDFGLLRRLAGAALRRVLRRPLDSIAFIVAAAASLAILVNALFLQSGRHPAPLMRAHARTPAAADTTGALERMIPRPRPLTLTRVTPPAASRSKGEIITLIQQELARRGYYDAAPDGIWGPKSDAAVRAFAQRSGLKVPTDPGEAMLQMIERASVKAAPAHVSASAPPAPRRDTLTPADAALPSLRLMAVQRVLADYGYGQIEPTGIEDAHTRAAITTFERERNLPPTGRMSDQLVRELAAMTGRPLE
jgi:peptidoglycan hydrolase-like protein with peptidoglycan-binding domain